MNHSVMFLFFSNGKVPVWQTVTLHITSTLHLYPGCHSNVVAMRSIYPAIWTLQMSPGAARNNKALVKLRTVKTHTHFPCWSRVREKVCHRLNVWVEHQVVWISSYCDSSGIIPSSEHSVRNIKPNAHCELFSLSDEYHEMLVEIKVQPDIRLPPTSLISHPPPPQSRGSCMTHVSAPVTRGSVQEWEYHLLAFQELIPPLSCKWESVHRSSVFITTWS